MRGRWHRRRSFVASSRRRSKYLRDMRSVRLRFVCTSESCAGALWRDWGDVWRRRLRKLEWERREREIIEQWEREQREREAREREERELMELLEREERERLEAERRRQEEVRSDLCMHSIGRCGWVA